MVFLDESGSSDQIDINRMVFLDLLVRWSTIRKVDPDRAQKVGGRPGPGLVLPPLCSRVFWSLLDDRKLRDTLISLCKPDM